MNSCSPETEHADIDGIDKRNYSQASRLTLSKPFPTRLSSERLALRPLCAGDVEPLYRYRSLPEVARFQSWTAFDLDDAKSVVAEQAGRQPNLQGTWFQYAIVEQASSAMVGDCGLHCLFDDPRQMELGITIAPYYQRHGYATEALASLLDVVFGSFGKHRVFALTDAQNNAAASLFRKLGFRQEAHFVEHKWHKSAWSSEFIFAILRREWEAMRTSPPSRDC
jgi:RimJ/RimL family protein N-acetyltransferase